MRDGQGQCERWCIRPISPAVEIELVQADGAEDCLALAEKEGESVGRGDEQVHEACAADPCGTDRAGRRISEFECMPAASD